MRLILLILGLLSSRVLATQILKLDHTWPNHQQCAGIYGQSQFSPATPSSIIVSFPDLDLSAQSGLVSVVIFEIRDEHLGGITIQDSSGHKTKEILCTRRNIERNICTEKELGTFIITPTAHQKAYNPLITRAINTSHPISLIYPVKNPGYYCVATASFSGLPFEGKMHVFDGPGLLPSYLKPALWYSRSLAFTALAAMLLYGIWAVGNPDRKIIRGIFGSSTLVVLSCVDALIKWIDLELRNRAVGEIIAISSMIVANSVRILQTILLLYYFSRLCHDDRDSVSWKSRVATWIWVPVALLSSILTTEGISSAYTSAALGLVLMTASIFGIWGLQRPPRRQFVLEKVGRELPRRSLVFILLVLLGFMLVFAVNSYAIFAYGNAPQLLEEEYWMSMWFWMNGGAYELLFLLAVPGLVVCLA